MNDFFPKVGMSIFLLFSMFCGVLLLKEVYENDLSIGDTVVETTKSKRSGKIYKKEIRTYTFWDTITEEIIGIPMGILLIGLGVWGFYYGVKDESGWLR